MQKSLLAPPANPADPTDPKVIFSNDQLQSRAFKALIVGFVLFLVTSFTIYLPAPFTETLLWTKYAPLSLADCIQAVITADLDVFPKVYQMFTLIGAILSALLATRNHKKIGLYLSISIILITLSPCAAFISALCVSKNLEYIFIPISLICIICSTIIAIQRLRMAGEGVTSTHLSSVANALGGWCIAWAFVYCETAFNLSDLSDSPYASDKELLNYTIFTTVCSLVSGIIMLIVANGKKKPGKALAFGFFFWLLQWTVLFAIQDNFFELTLAATLLVGLSLYCFPLEVFFHVAGFIYFVAGYIIAPLFRTHYGWDELKVPGGVICLVFCFFAKVIVYSHHNKEVNSIIRASNDRTLTYILGVGIALGSFILNFGFWRLDEAITKSIDELYPNAIIAILCGITVIGIFLCEYIRQVRLHSKQQNGIQAAV